MGTYPVPSSIKQVPITTGLSVQIAPQNITRNALYVFNASPVAVLWVCPALSNDQTTLAAVAAGSGSIPIQPGTGLLFQGFTSAMNAIAQGNTATVTVWEYYQ